MQEHNRSSSTDIEDRNGGLMLQMARPDIYRVNAFRILEVPTTASPREISSQLRKIGLMEKLGKTESAERGILPLSPPPDANDRRHATERVNDPESRLIDELFWFWPLGFHAGQDGDEALMAMRKGDIPGAVSIWKRHEQESSEANVSMHNLAVLHHAMALDLEYEQPTEPEPKTRIQEKQSYWQQAFPRWKTLLQNEGFWQRLKERVADLDDPRLTTGTARRIRDGLPLVLLSINSTLAAQCALNGNNEEALLHVHLVRESGFDSAVADEALRRAVVPMRDRVKIMCANAEREAKDNPEHGHDVASQLIEQTSGLLSTIDILLSQTHPTRETVHDSVAAAILTSQIQFGEKTKEWPLCVKLLEQALQIAVGDFTRQRINENIEIARNNMKFGTCWFCDEFSAHDKAAVEVKMHGNVNRTWAPGGTRITWQHTKIRVPRCSQCKSAHVRMSTFMGLGALLGIALGIGGCVVSSSGAGLGWGALSFLICGAAGCAIGYVVGRRGIPKTIKAESDWAEFHAVKEKKAQGWAMGDKPASTG